MLNYDYMGEQKLKVTFCQYNDQSKEVIDVLKEKYTQYQVSITRCIYCCGECSEKPIARINGALLIGNTSKDLINKILNC